MTDLKLALRITQEGAGQVRVALDGVADANIQVEASAKSATGALGQEATAFDAVGQGARRGGTGLDSLAEANQRVAGTTTAAVAALGQQSTMLQALSAQAQTTQKTLSAALGMSGVRHLSQEFAQSQAYAATQAKAAEAVAASQAAQAAARAQAERGTIQVLLDEAHAASVAAAAQAKAAQSTRALVLSEVDLKSVLTSIQTPQERHAAQLAKVTALYEAGALSTAQYHRAVVATRNELSQAERAMANAASSGDVLGVSVRSLAVGFAAITAVGLVKHLVETDAKLQAVDTRIAFFADNSQAAAAAQTQLMATAKALNADYLTLADTYAKLLPLEQSGLITHQQTQDLLVGMTNAGKALGASNTQLGQTFFGLSQALSSGVVRAEELNQTVEPLPGLLQAMDRAARLPAGGFRQLVNDGKVTSELFATTLVQALHEFDGAAARAGNNIDALTQRVHTAWLELAKESDGLITSVVKTTTNLGTTSIEYVTESLRQWKAWLKEGADILGNGVPDDAMAAERAAQGKPPKAGDSVGPTIDDKTRKEREKEIQDAAKAAEAADKTLKQSKVELLKTQGQYAEALKLEAELRGLSGEQAKRYIDTELATIQAKEAGKAATKAQTSALKEQHDALTLLNGLLEKSQNPWEKYVAKGEALAKAVNLIEQRTGQRYGNDDLARMSQALNEELDQERLAYAKSDAAMAAHVEAYRDQQKAQSEVIASLQAEKDALHYVGVERSLYTHLQKAGVSADSEAGQQIAALTREIAAAEAASKSSTQAAAQWQGAWEQAGRNVHDALTDLFEGLFNGQASSFDQFITDLQRTANRLSANTAASALEGLVLPYINGLFNGGSGAPAFQGQAVSSGLGSFWQMVSSWFTDSQSYAQAQTANAAAMQRGDFSGYDPTEGYARAGSVYSGAGLSQGNTYGAAMAAAQIALSLLIDPNRNYGGNYTSNKTGLQAQKAFTTITDLLGNFIPFLKLAKYDLALQYKLGYSMYPDRRPDLVSSILGGPLFGFLFGDVVKSGVGGWWNNVSGLQVNASYAQNGAPLGLLQAGGDALTDSLLRAQDVLGVDMGQFGIEMRNRGDRFWLRGYDTQGNTFSNIGGSKGIRLTDTNLQGQLGLFMTAVMKRQEVLQQFDDFMVRGAIQAGQDLSEISANLNAVQRLRVFEGEATDLGPQLAKDRAQYAARQRLIMDYAGGQRETAELAKLDAAYQRQFADRVRTFQDTLAGLIGQSTDGIGAAVRDIDTQFAVIRAQNKELADAAKKSKGKLSYSPLTEADITADQLAAVAKLRDSVVSAIRDMTGEAQPLTDELQRVAEYFGYARQHADELGLSLAWLDDQEAKAISAIKDTWSKGLKDTLTATAQSVRDVISGADGTLARLTKEIETGLAGFAGLDSQTDVQSSIAKITGLIQDRYQLEMDNITAVVNAAKGLREMLSSLDTSTLSPLSPGERLSSIARQYGTALLKTQAGDAIAAGQVGGLFQSYLSQAASTYGTASAEYRQIYESGKASVGQAADNILTGAESRLASLTESTLALVDTFSKRAQAQIDALNANTAALHAVLKDPSKAEQAKAINDNTQALLALSVPSNAPTPDPALLLKGWQK